MRVRHASQQKEISIVSHDEIETAHPAQLAGKPTARQGIMVFSSSSTMLYANGDARYFLKRLNQDEKGYPTDGAFPAVITNLYDKMRKTLESRSAAGDDGWLEVNRSVVGQDRPVLLHIFGLPDRLGRQRSRVVIRMEELTPSSHVGPPEAVPPSA